MNLKSKISIKDIEYVYFDMDGTLLTSNKTISPRSIETLNKLWSRKISCSIATGRPYYFAQNEIKTLEPHLPIISCNGALVFDYNSKKIISYDSIDKNTTKTIFDILIKNNAVFIIYTKEQMFMYKDNATNPESKWLNWIYNHNNKFDISDRANISFIEDLDNFDIKEYDVIKFLIIYSEIPTERYSVIESNVSKLNDVYIVKSQNEVFDIMPKGLSKGHGLQVLHDKGIIDLNKTLVFGDAENDLSMFAKAKWSVAMGNAQEKTKHAATFITNSNNEDGIANFFDKLFEAENKE
ncbi:MAG: HAD family hydrolase [Mycoplasma sp.]|nr:HAD family hydrolase [Mycoplasma sp.]